MRGETVVLSAQGIEKEFVHPSPFTVLKGISLTARAKESIAIVGKSGSGKSTLLHILGTLERASKGELTLLGQKVCTLNSARLRKEHIGFVFQAFHLFEESSVMENLLIPAKIARKSTHKKGDAYQRALMLLDEVGLLSRLHYPAKLLSGGEKQRVAIARALINKPDILFADEPTGNLDRKQSEQIHNLLLSLSAKEGKTLVIVTHDVNLASQCTRTYHLQDGILLS